MIHCKTRMWHDNNKQISCCSTLFYYIILFTAELKHFRFYMVEQFQSCLEGIGSQQFLFIWSEKSFCLLSYLRTIQQEKSIVHKKTDDSYIDWQRLTTIGTTSDNDWLRVVQWVTTNDNERQRVTANENEWQQIKMNDSKCQRVVQRIKTNDNK